jgi:Type IV secretion system pilin
MKKILFLFLILLTLISTPSVTWAQNGAPGTCGDGVCQSYESAGTCSVDCSTTSTRTTNSTCAAKVSNIGDLICKLNDILSAIIPFLILLGVVYFVWGVVQYVIGDDEEAKKKGKDRMIYGIIGLVVIVSLWGLVAIVTNTFKLNNTTPIVTNLTPTPKSQASGTCTLAANPKLGDLLEYVTCFIGKSVIPLVFALAIVMFVWGVVQYVIGANEEKERMKGKQFMIWGVIALAVMLSVWGLVSIFTKTFNIDVKFVPQVKQ